MDIETVVQPVCMVSGALAFIMHVSRIGGVAPVSMKRVRGGWLMSMSPFYYAYSLLVVATLHTIISFTVFDRREDVVDGYEPASNTGFMRIVTLVLGVIQLVVGIIIGLTGYHRLRYVIHCMAHLQQINNEFNLLSIPSTTSEIKIWLKVIILLIHGYIGAFVDCGIYLYDVIVSNDKVPFVAFSMILTYFNVLHLQLLAIQFHLVVMTLVSTQQRLNKYLQSLLEESKQDLSAFSLGLCSTEYIKYMKEFRINVPIRTSYRSNDQCTPSYVSRGSRINPETIRQLINIYCLLCDIIRKLNECHGIPIIMLLLYCAVYTITSPYFVVTVLMRTHSQIPIFKIVSIFGYCSLCYAMIAIGTEACHQSHIKLKITKKIINQIMRFVPRETSAYYQFKMFRRHILLNPVRFSPMHLMKYDRNLSVAVLSAVITYMTVFINL